MSRGNSGHPAAFIAMIGARGPVTASDYALAAGVSRAYANLMVRRMLERASDGTRAVHIESWRREQENGRSYPRAVIEAGDGEDAPKPRALTRLQLNRRNHKRRKMLQASSVFRLGIPCKNVTKAHHAAL